MERKTVILVDDEPITRMDVSDMLQELGFDVVGEGADGFDAIELCRAKHPNIALMDIKMPIFDGLAASETILSENLADCVVLLTAFSDQDIVSRASEAGVTGYLVKPIDQASLLPTLEVAYAQSLRLRESRKEAADARRRIQEDRQIHKAQQYIAKTQNCSTNEAYRTMRKTAMDKRISVAMLAERILLQASRDDSISEVKAYLIRQKKMTDERAYQYIVNYGKTHGLSTEQAAKELKKHFAEV